MANNPPAYLRAAGLLIKTDNTYIVRFVRSKSQFKPYRQAGQIPGMQVLKFTYL